MSNNKLSGLTLLYFISQGTGIGLSLCKDLTELLGGTIELDESYHSGIEGCPGTRLVITLNTPPMDMEEYQMDGMNAEKSPLDAKSSLPDLPDKLNVLFVDDDLILRKLFARSLKRVVPNWVVEEATNGETAVRLVEGIPADGEGYDIIFCK